MKHIYIAYFWNSEDDKDFYWFIGNNLKSPEDQFIKHYNKEYAVNELDEEDVIGVYRIDDKDILEVAKSIKA